MNPFQRLLITALLPLGLAAPAAAFEPGLEPRPEPGPIETREAPAPERSFREANGDLLRADIADALADTGRAFRLDLSLTRPMLDAPMPR